MNKKPIDIDVVRQPEFLLSLMTNLDSIRAELPLLPIECMILYRLRDNNIFTQQDVSAIIESNRSMAYENRPTMHLNKLVRLGYAKGYTYRGLKNYFVTSDGKLFLRDLAKKMEEIVTNSLPKKI